MKKMYIIIFILVLLILAGGIAWLLVNRGVSYNILPNRDKAIYLATQELKKRGDGSIKDLGNRKLFQAAPVTNNPNEWSVVFFSSKCNRYRSNNYCGY